MGRADSKLSAIKAIFSLLSQDTTIKSYVGTKIYPIIAPQGTEGDFIAIQRDGYRLEYTKMGVALQRSVFFVTAVSDDYNRGLSIAEAVRDVLVGDHSALAIRIKLEDYGEDYVDKKFIQVLKFSIE